MRISPPVLINRSGSGDLDSARVWWQKALELEPENETIKQKLGPEQ